PTAPGSDAKRVFQSRSLITTTASRPGASSSLGRKKRPRAGLTPSSEKVLPVTIWATASAGSPPVERLANREGNAARSAKTRLPARRSFQVSRETEWKLEPSGAVACTLTSSDWRATAGKGFNRKASRIEKTVATAQIPSADVRITTAEVPGLLR